MSTTPTLHAEASGNDPGRLEDASRIRVFAILTVIVLFTEVAPVQYTIVAAALQKISPSFPGVGANITWSMIVYGLVGAAASPLIGKMSDIWGKKRMFLACGLFFIVGCGICALTSSWTLFLLGRALQAIAVATAVIAYGLIRDLLPRRYVPLGMGVTATGLGFSALLGPVLGGWLVDDYSWRAIFWVLLGYTVVMVPLVWFVVPESKLRTSGRLDIAGALLLAAGIGLVLLYIDKGQDWGWARPRAWAWLLAGLVLIAVFGVVERRVSHPVMDVRLLVNPKVGLTLFVALFAAFIIGVQSYTIPYMTQSPDSRTAAQMVAGGAIQKAQAAGVKLPPQAVDVALKPGYSYGEGWSLTGYATHIAIWLALLSMVTGALAGAWARKVGPRRPMLLALTVMAATGVGFAVCPFGWVTLLLLALPFGAAIGGYYASAPNLIVEAVPQEQQGVSAGMLAVMQTIGVAVGVAAATAFNHAHPVRAVVAVAGRPNPAVDIPGLYSDRGYELGFWFVAGTTVVALIAALVMRHGRAPATGGTAH